MKLFKFLMFLSVLIISMHMTVVCFAQTATPAPSATPAISAPATAAQATGIWGFFMAHGGPEATVLLLVTSFNAVMSLIRDQMAAWDGVDATQPIDPQYSKLTFFNKLALYSGKLMDLLMANTKHV
jgi:hypothetical protein